VVKAGSTAAITDASGNKWTITAGAQVAVNGTVDAVTANVTQLGYVNGTIWQENSDKMWWGETKPNDAWANTAGTATSPLPTSVTIPQTQASTTVSLSQVSVVATAGDHMLFISGTGDTMKLSGGTNTVTDTGGSNTYVLPAAGKGYDAFTSNVLTAKDTFDLHTALAATNWTGSTATLSNYLRGDHHQPDDVARPRGNLKHHATDKRDPRWCDITGGSRVPGMKAREAATPISSPGWVSRHRSRRSEPPTPPTPRPRRTPRACHRTTRPHRSAMPSRRPR